MPVKGSNMQKWLSSALLLCTLFLAPLAHAQIVSQIPWTVGYGGTGFSTYTIGDMVYAATTSTFAKLVSPATGQVITSGGAGVAPAWSASPTLTTSLTAPLLIGGTAVGSTLTLKSTIAVGTTDAIIFQVGSNGATEAMRIGTAGMVGIGMAPNTNQLGVTASTVDAALGNTVDAVYTSTITANSALGFRGIQSTANLNQSGFNATANPSVRAMQATTNVTGATGTVTAAASVAGILTNTGAGTLTNGSNFHALGVANSGGGTLTNAYGLFVENFTAASTINAGLSSNLTAAATRWNIYAVGTAQNYFAGSVGVGIALPLSPVEVSYAPAAGSPTITDANWGLSVQSTTAAAVATGPTLSFKGSSGNGVALYPFAQIQGSKDSAVGADYSGRIGIYTINSAGGTVERLRIDGLGLMTYTAAAGTGTVAPSHTFTEAAHTGLTASAERFDINFNSARTVQWATGALTTQRFNVFQAPTVDFVGASTVTDTCTLCITGAPVKGTNATLSSTHGLLIQAGAVSTATAAYGITVNAPTGATTNYAGQFKGEVLMGSIAFASLGTPANGTITYCSNCDPPTLVESTCTSAGAATGSFAVRVNGAWKCLG